MADFGIIEGLAIAGAIAAAATTTAGAVAQNRAVKRSIASQREAQAVQSKQLQDAAALERAKGVRNSELVRARLRVAAAAAGVGESGSYASLERQAVIDSTTNSRIIDLNLSNQLAALASGTRAANINAINQSANPILSAFSGAISGAQSGASIGNTINEYRPNNPPAATNYSVGAAEGLAI